MSRRKISIRVSRFSDTRPTTNVKSPPLSNFRLFMCGIPVYHFFFFFRCVSLPSSSRSPR